MKTTQKALTWFNSLGNTRREELSLAYYGSKYLMDSEILEMYFEEVPHKNLEEVISVLKSFSAKFVANTETAYKEEEIREWIENNLLSL